jgi:putative copper export protein
MKWLVLIHLLGATIWAGGHLVLSIGFLPVAIRKGDLSVITFFEQRYERIGLPALLAQVVTGVWMAAIYVPFREWLSLATTHHRFLWVKLGLLLVTLALALHARLFLIPQLTREKLPALAFHIVLVTMLAVAFVVVGLSFRFTYL